MLLPCLLLERAMFVNLVICSTWLTISPNRKSSKALDLNLSYSVPVITSIGTVTNDLSLFTWKSNWDTWSLISNNNAMSLQLFSWVKGSTMINFPALIVSENWVHLAQRRCLVMQEKEKAESNDRCCTHTTHGYIQLSETPAVYVDRTWLRQ